MLPFHVTNLFGNEVQLTGVAIPKHDGLHVCVHEGEVPTDLFDAKTKSIVIEWSNVQEITVKESMFGDSLTIRLRARNMALPGTKNDHAKLDLHKRDRERYDEFRQQVEQFRAGIPDENVEEMIDDIRDFLTDH